MMFVPIVPLKYGEVKIPVRLPVVHFAKNGRPLKWMHPQFNIAPLALILGFPSEDHYREDLEDLDSLGMADPVTGYDQRRADKMAGIPWGGPQGSGFTSIEGATKMMDEARGWLPANNLDAFRVSVNRQLAEIEAGAWQEYYKSVLAEWERVRACREANEEEAARPKNYSIAFPSLSERKIQKEVDDMLAELLG